MDGGDTTNAVCDAACTLARDVSAKAIIALTKSGHTARSMSKFRPKEPIIAATPETRTFYQLALSWGVYPVPARSGIYFDELFRFAVQCAKGLNLLSEGDTVVIAAGLPMGVSGTRTLSKWRSIRLVEKLFDKRKKDIGSAELYSQPPLGELSPAGG